MSAFDPAQAITITLPNGNFQIWDLDVGEGSGKGPVRECYSRNWQENLAVWHIACKWSDRQSIAVGMLGNSVAGVYTLPEAYYAVPAWVCKKIECRGVGIASPDPVNGFISFPYCTLDISFGVPDFQNNQLVSEMELDFSSNSVAVDQTSATFKYASGANVPPSALPAYRLTTVFGSIKLYNRSTLNTGLYIPSMDNTNSTTFQGVSAGKVMFKGARTDRIFTAVGLLQYNVTLLFELNPRGWDAILQPGVGWTTYTFLSGSAPWTSSDLNGLLI